MKGEVKIKSSIFVPKTIRVGYQERDDTYTKQLAYVIYYDQTGKLRKEGSWNSWRDDKIEPNDFENIPTIGFVLNKKVGDYCYDWNHRQAYVRVYDPRNFEFEITIENLLYILENASSIKGKGLEGEFVYGWDGKDLVLLPVDSPDYQSIEKYNDIVFNNDFIKAKDLVIGATYFTKDNQEMIYMGKFDVYGSGYKASDGTVFTSYKKYDNYVNDNYDRLKQKYGGCSYDYVKGILTGKEFVFAYKNDCNYIKQEYCFTHYSSISKKFIAISDNTCHENYANIFDLLECQEFYSPINNENDKYVLLSFDEFVKSFENYDWNRKFYSLQDNEYISYSIRKVDKENNLYRGNIDNNSGSYKNKLRTRTTPSPYSWGSSYQEPIPTALEEIYEILQPCYKEIYLQNGKLYEKEYYYE